MDEILAVEVLGPEDLLKKCERCNEKNGAWPVKAFTQGSWYNAWFCGTCIVNIDERLNKPATIAPQNSGTPVA